MVLWKLSIVDKRTLACWCTRIKLKLLWNTGCSVDSESCLQIKVSWSSPKLIHLRW